MKTVPFEQLRKEYLKRSSARAYRRHRRMRWASRPIKVRVKPDHYAVWPTMKQLVNTIVSKLPDGMEYLVEDFKKLERRIEKLEEQAKAARKERP